MYKKIIAILLSLCIIFGTLPVIAQAEATVNFSEEEIFARVGETVELKLDLSGCNGFMDLGIEIEYNRDVMSLGSAESNTSVGSVCTMAQTFETFPYNIGWSGTKNTYFNGTLATVVFKIEQDAPDGVYYVNIDYYKGRNGKYKDGISVNYDENDNPLNLTYGHCRIVVEGNNNTPGGGGEATDSVIASLSSNEGYAGENVDITLDLSNNTGFSNLGFEIGYDSAVLTLLKVTDTSGVGGTFTPAQYISTNPYNFGWDSVSDIGYNGTLATFTFKINENAPSGEYPVTVSHYKGRNGNYKDGVDVNYDENGNALDILYKDGCINVLETPVEEPDESVYRVEFISEKTEYAIGEEFLVDVWLYTDDYAVRIYENDYEVTGFDSSRAGMYDVTVSYGGYSQQFKVEVIEDKEIEIIQTYVVQAVATEGVAISPSGYSEVKDSTVMKFMILPQAGYELEGVYLNGEKTEIVDSTLSVTINENTVVEVKAKKQQYFINSTTNKNGHIEIPNTALEYGSNCTAIIVADDGYIVSDVFVDGVSVGACKYYTFTNINETHTIEAVFEELIKTVTVKATSSEGGKVYPAKSIVNSGSNAKITATPDYGYHIDYVLRDGIKQTAVNNEVLVENITKDTDIKVVFAKNLYTVAVNNSEGVRMSVEYDGQSAESIQIPYMENAEIVINIEDGYKLNTLYVDSTPVKAQKLDGKLVYKLLVSKDTVVSARCGLTLVSEYNIKVSQAGLAADINADNAEAKKEIFTQLADEYALLSTAEQRACTSAYATVLSALDRANAYIALNKSNIIERISALYKLDITSQNYRSYKQEIDSIYSEYEKMTQLSKSLVDYGYITKLNELKKRTEEFDKQSKGVIAYLYELIRLVPEYENLNADNLSEAYSKLMLAEETYYNMSEQDKNDVSEEKYNELISKHGSIATQIQKLYVTPFTGKVLRSSPVTSADSFSTAESKRVVIYELMNEYHAFPIFVQEQIPSSTVQKLNSLYESASIKVSTTVNNLPVDMNGDFDEDVDLVLTEPEIDNSAVSDATGKTVFQAIDVKMYSNEQEVQPTSKIRIKMEIGRELASADVSVVYINDDGVMFDVQGEIIEENGIYYVVFFTDHFSSFAILYNESSAEKPKINFESEYAETGDTVTVNVTGGINTSNCITLITGRSIDGEVTFVKMGSGNTSAVVADNTHTIKAMLWNKSLAPVTDAIILTVTE